MARTKQTARKSCGGKAPRKMMQATSAQQLRQFMTGRQAASYSGTGSQQQDKTSYLVSYFSCGVELNMYMYSYGLWVDHAPMTSWQFTLLPQRRYIHDRG